MRFCSCGQPVFSTDKITGIGYCKFHSYKRTDTDKRSIIQKAVSKNVSKNEISKVRRLKSMEENLELVNKKKELDEWFAYHMQNSKKVCENCGADLSHYNKKDWYGSQHHVLEKSIFYSVSTVLSNHVVLGKWCCHSQFHTSMFNTSKMKIFDKCKTIVKELVPLLTTNEISKISEYYGNLATN